jgi:hypothetical protein
MRSIYTIKTMKSFKEKINKKNFLLLNDNRIFFKFIANIIFI